MNFYQVIPEIQLPSVFLTYQSPEDYDQGRVVLVPVQNRLHLAVIWKKLDPDSTFGYHLKNIKNPLPYWLNVQQLNLVSLFWQNSFNSFNLIINSFLQPLSLLTQEQKNQLLNVLKVSKQNNQNNQEILISQESSNYLVNYEFEINIWMRIMYLIRNALYKNKNMLIIFPEYKMLDKIFRQIKSEEPDLPIFVFTGQQSTANNQLVFNLLQSKATRATSSKPQPNSSSHAQIVFGTRSSLFLPFQTLDEIILVDEANNMYIQEQNSLYFDTREAVFLMSKAFSANLTYLSTLPSSRLYNFYSEKGLKQDITKITTKQVKPLKIHFTKREPKIDQFELLSDQLLEILSSEDDLEGKFFTEEDG
jgi:primosomal protein N'